MAMQRGRSVAIKKHEPKPCPLCGSADVTFRTLEQGDLKPRSSFVLCNCCGARSRSWNGRFGEHLAVAAWNQRTSDDLDKLEAEVKRLQASHDELVKIAALVGEQDDPFAAWESLEGIVEAQRPLLEALEGLLSATEEVGFVHYAPLRRKARAAIKQAKGE